MINCNTNQVDTTIPVGTNPSALIWNPLNNKVYCANNWSDNVSVIDGSTNRVDTTIHVGMWPRSFAVNTINNYIYCAVEETDRVVVINGANQQIITQIIVGDSPYEVIWNPNSNKIYCTNRNSDNVTIINGATNQVITTVSVGDAPWFLAHNSTDNKVYCSNNGNRTISVINGVTDQVDTTLNMVLSNAWDLLWNRTNNKLYCCLYWPSTVRVTDCRNNQIVGTFIVGFGPRPLAWDSIDNRVYVGCYDGEKVSVLRDEMGIEEKSAEYSIDKTETNHLLIYPNPFHSYTKISVPKSQLNVPSSALSIYDISGKLVRFFSFSSNREQLDNYIIWDGRSDTGKPLDSGVYFCKFGSTSAVQKVLISK